MISDRKRRAYRDAEAALSRLRGHPVQVLGNHTIAHLQRLVDRCNEAVPYAERTGDWTGARLYVTSAYTWEQIERINNGHS